MLLRVTAIATPEEARSKLKALYAKGELLSLALSAESFPATLKIRKPAATVLNKDLRAVAVLMDSFQRLKLKLNYVTVPSRVMGEQRVPSELIFATPEELFTFIGKAREWKDFKALFLKVTAREPQAAALFQMKPLYLLENADALEGVLRVVDFLRAHGRSGLYLRQVEIAGNDTKFIERHKPLISLFVNALLADPHYGFDVSSTAREGFEERYGFRKKSPLVRFRFLDPELRPDTLPAADDLALDVNAFSKLRIGSCKILIVENEITYLSLRSLPRTVAIFGLGKAVVNLKSVAWLKDCSVYYMGDLDCDGLSILSSLREALRDRDVPVRSLLMDEATFRRYGAYAVESKVAVKGEPSCLTEEELKLYRLLSAGGIGSRDRLEQELLPLGLIERKLTECLSPGAEQGV